MKCQYCERSITNAGSLRAHEMSCGNNPNRVKHKHSPTAGRRKGSVAWNKGVTNTDKMIETSVDFFNSGRYKECTEAVARRHAKRLLLHKEGHSCSICGTSEWMSLPVPLVCDHISGNSEDNRLENFRLVCANCDAQLPTYKSKNRGNGRSYDREYYKLRKANPIAGDGTRLENERA